MRLIISVVVILFIATLSAPKANAIVFLPAIVLIPIAKIVALIMAGFSFPALGAGALWSKLFRKSFKRVFVIIFIILILLVFFSAVFLKLINPDRPLF
jgi:hypothetical protein